MIIYSDLKESFFLLDYTPSHSQLVLRNKKNKNRNHNIDIIFKGVAGLLIPMSFNGIEISLINLSNGYSFLIDNYGFKLNKDYQIFSLTNSNRQGYFINAGCFGVYHNNLDILESSIGRYDMGDLGENVLWFAE